MQRTMRIVCLAYVAFLTLLLLSPNPARVISFSGKLPPILHTLMPWAHLMIFSVLAAAMLLALAHAALGRRSDLGDVRGSHGDHPNLSSG